MESVAPSLHFEHVYLKYQGYSIFRDLTFSLEAGKFHCLLGRSGVGKSTLLKLIAGLEMEDITGLRANIFTSDGRDYHSNVAYMAQEDGLLPWLSVVDNVMVGKRLRGESVDKATLIKASHMLKLVGLSDVSEAKPDTLSGGMRQRVALARTLFEDKSIVLLDEPFARLDAMTRFELQRLTSQLLSSKTVLLITHDPIEAMLMADKIAIMYGRPAVITPYICVEMPRPRDFHMLPISELHNIVSVFMAMEECA